MADLSRFLEPVPGAQEAGEDLSASSALFELETLARGKPETQFSAGEPPDWRVVAKTCEDLLARSRDFRVAVTFAAALLRTQGLAGLADGLALLRGLTERFWPTAFPLLDAEDDNDPTERANAVGLLSAPVGADGDTLRFLAGLRDVPVAASPTLGRYTLGALLAGRQNPPPEGTPPAATLAAALKDTPPADRTAWHAAATAAVEAATGLDAAWTQRVGAGRGPNFSALLADLKALQSFLAPEPVVAPSTRDDAPAAEAGETPAGGAGSPAGRPGVLRTRADVVRTLEAVCDYYRRQEPGSPVPYLLRRAIALVDKDFVALLNDLTPDGVATFKVISGPLPEDTPPPA